MKLFSVPLLLITFSLLTLAASARAESPHADVERHLSIHEEREDYLAWPAIARTDDGDIVVLYTRTDEHLGPNGQILLSRSTDNGQTWEEPVVAFDTLIDDRESGVTELSDGSLLGHFWSTHWTAHDYESLGENAYYPEIIEPWIERVNELDYLKAAHLEGAWNALSTDGGRTWSDPVKGKDSIHGGVELQNGKLLVAAYRQEGQNIAINQAEGPLKPWQRIANVVTPHPTKIRFGEPHLTQLRNGRIILLIRATAIPYNDKSPRSYIWASYSDDNGHTWADPYQTPLWGLPPHVTQLSDGRVLATYGHRRSPYGQRVCISEDGVTWLKENELIIRGDAPNGDLGYPVSLELEPGRVLTVYYQSNVPPGTHQQNRPPLPDRVKPGILGTIWNVPEPEPHPALIELGERRELFVDGEVVQKLKNTELRLHHPERHGAALQFDSPWEGGWSAYPTVIKDGDTYKMYYRAMGSTADGDLPYVCYAESRDGIVWSKPDLGLFAFEGSRNNNIILTEEPFSHNFSPFIDTRPGVPDNERFKAVAGTEKSGLFGFVSADGIHWEKILQDPIHTRGLYDSHNVAFWSESEQQYVCYYRTWTGEGYTGYRTISRATSDDFINWSDGAEMYYGNTPREQLYTNGTHPYFRAPHIYVALAKRFFPQKAAISEDQGEELVDNPAYRIASSDSVFMTSRGGYEYDRSFMEALIRPGPSPRDWIARDNTPALGVVPGNNREMFLYRMSHYAQPTAHISRYSLRMDGFVSIEAPYEGSEVLTRLLSFNGDRLEINYATSAAGEIRVEILDADDTPIPGFTRDQSQLIFGDEISRIVTWDHGPDLSSLAGQPVQLRFYMRDANLYSFRFFSQEEK